MKIGSKYKNIVTNIIAGLCFSLALALPAMAGESPGHPPISAGVPFFYYQNLEAAANWYETKLGLKKVADKDWVVIFALTPSSQIGLVNATGGSLTPTENKGALLSIETQDLEGWYEKLKNVEGIDMIHGIQVGAQGLVDEFRMTDPGGYIVEFFRWRQDKAQRMRHD